MVGTVTGRAKHLSTEIDAPTTITRGARAVNIPALHVLPRMIDPSSGERMTGSTRSPHRFNLVFAAAIVAAALLGGCTVVTVASSAVGVAATGVGLAADAAVGAVKVTGKAVGAVLPGGE
jgi:hypothetical protein